MTIAKKAIIDQIATIPGTSTASPATQGQIL
jgi:hypothetical protein